ncbi:MAG: queuosine salvage family protein [Nanoarchaeota archaeon]|nr:queuosine salvage family protein [Nanoarchaeota archaeon]
MLLNALKSFSMIDSNTILDSVKYVVDNSGHVKINTDMIKDHTDAVIGKGIHWEDVAPIKIPELDKEKKIAFFVVFNALNFSYWGKPKWTIEYKGKEYDGCWGMLGALSRSIEEKQQLFDSASLKHLSEDKLNQILRGNTEIPLFKERLQLLNEIGKIVNEKYGGKFSGLLDAADNDAFRLLELLTEFPCFNDYIEFKGKQVFFYKKVQLAVCDLSKFCQGNLKNINHLTAAADYKIPQILRKYRILEYSEALANKIDKKIEINPGSNQEIEIRANTVWAVELMKQAINDPNVTATDIDHYLWIQGQKKEESDKPYHRTRTIFY